MARHQAGLVQQRRMLRALGFGFLEEPFEAPVAREAAPQPPAMPSAEQAEPPQKRVSEQGRALEQDAAWLEGQPVLTRAEREAALAALAQEASKCLECVLHNSRSNVVFGEGNPEAGLMFIGEAPTEAEDRTGQIAEGDTGKLLLDIIKAMQFAREDVFITNAVKCCTVRGRPPHGDELEKCRPFIEKQIAIVRPRVIVALGEAALTSLLPHRASEAFPRLRGNWLSWHGIKVMPTFAPSYIIRNRDRKKRVWEDMQLVMREFGKKT